MCQERMRKTTEAFEIQHKSRALPLHQAVLGTFQLPACQCAHCVARGRFVPHSEPAVESESDCQRVEAGETFLLPFYRSRSIIILPFESESARSGSKFHGFLFGLICNVVLFVSRA